jgi:hypothetical protein
VAAAAIGTGGERVRAGYRPNGSAQIAVQRRGCEGGAGHQSRGVGGEEDDGTTHEILDGGEPPERVAGESLRGKLRTGENGDRIIQSAKLTGDRNVNTQVAGSGNVVG